MFEAYLLLFRLLLASLVCHVRPVPREIKITTSHRASQKVSEQHVEHTYCFAGLILGTYKSVADCRTSSSQSIHPSRRACPPTSPSQHPPSTGMQFTAVFVLASAATLVLAHPTATVTARAGGVTGLPIHPVCACIRGGKIAPYNSFSCSLRTLMSPNAST